MHGGSSEFPPVFPSPGAYTSSPLLAGIQKALTQSRSEFNCRMIHAFMHSCSKLDAGK